MSTENQYWTQKWDLDFDIYHGFSKLTDNELKEYTRKLRDVLTANDTYCCVTLEAKTISVFGNIGGDNTQAEKILTEMCKRGCWLEENVYYEDNYDKWSDCKTRVISIESALRILTCGRCKNCVPEDSCGCDCLCTAKNIEVSQDDEISFYGEHFDENCEKFDPVN